MALGILAYGNFGEGMKFNCSNIQPNRWQHSYNKLWWVKFEWQPIKDSRSGCEVLSNHIRITVNGDHPELCSFRYIRIVDISYTALLELSRPPPAPLPSPPQKIQIIGIPPQQFKLFYCTPFWLFKCSINSTYLPGTQRIWYFIYYVLYNSSKFQQDENPHWSTDDIKTMCVVYFES